MKPTAVTVYDEKTVTALARVGMSKRVSPKLALAGKIAICAAIVIGMWIFFFSLRIKQGALPTTVLITFLGTALVLQYINAPYALYESRGRYKNQKITYTFLPDRMTTYSSIPGSVSQNSLEYDALDSIKETSEYFFVYRTPASAYVIDKEHLTDCTEDDVRQLLTSGGAKYILCKY